MTATATPSRTSPAGKSRGSSSGRHPGYRLLEIASGCGKVDAALGIIHGVKIVGLESRNIGRTISLDPKEFGDALNKTYSYSRQALESAIPMYEGVAVRIDHPASELDGQGRRVIKSSSRPALATFGELKNVCMKEDGLYGDLHLIKSHPSAAFMLEVAERMPSKLALSHNAYGVPVLQNGRAVIDQILEVYSVDIVGDKPGTTNGLFESHNDPNDPSEGETVTKTIKQIFESLPSATPGRSVLLEMMGDEMGGAPMGDLPVEVAPEASADDQINAAFRSAVMAAYDDPKLDTAATLAKMKEIMAAQDKLAGKSEAERPAEKVDGAAAQESLAETKLAERIQLLESRNQELELDRTARGLLESMGREITEVRLDSVKALPTDAKRKALIETWEKKADPAIAGRPFRSVPLVESEAGFQSETVEAFAAALKR